MSSMFRVVHLLPVFCFSVVVHLAVSSSESGPLPLPEAKYEVRIERSHFVPMRDGTRLSTDLYFPVGVEEKLPVVLLRTPYSKKPWRQSYAESGRMSHAGAHFFAGQGYVVAVQDVRGKWESEGIYEFYSHDRQDFSDTVAWLARQSWSTGKVGTFGCSYLGEIQIIQSTTRHPRLAAMIPQSSGSLGTAGGRYRYFSGVTGGAYELGMGLSWFPFSGSKYYSRPPSGLSREDYLKIVDFFELGPRIPTFDLMEVANTLPLAGIIERTGAAPNDWDTFVSTPLDDPYWESKGFLDRGEKVDVPALFVNGWHDYGVGETLVQFDHFRKHGTSEAARNHQFAIIGGGRHCHTETLTDPTVVGERNIGDPRWKFWETYLRWFDFWLKGIDNAVTKMPRFQYYLLGKNEWRSADDFPLPNTEFTKYYLHSRKGANSLWGDGWMSPVPPSADEAESDDFVYDPGNPVPSLGGPICCTKGENSRAGSYDQRGVEARQDVLVYSTPPLERGVEVTGQVEAVLYVSSSARDTDFTAKLVDVYPDGRAFNLQEGILRVRYREGFDKRVWMEDGEVYEVRIDVQAVGNYFGPGHRMRLEVSSSNFPRFDRNLNTGGNNYDETEWVVAENVVHHSERYPSHVILPVIPER